VGPLENLLVALIAVTSAAIVAMLLFVSLQLLFTKLEDARRDAFERRWQPVLRAWMHGERLALPPLPRRHRMWLMPLWNRTHNYVEGEAADFLRELAGAMQLEEHAAALLQERAAWKRSLAVLTLGELRSVAHWRELQALLDERRPAVVLAVIEAMVQIDRRRAAPLVVPVLLAGQRWDSVRTSRLLQVLGAEAVGPLCSALAQAPAGTAARTLGWLALTGQHEILVALRARLAGNSSADEIAVILEALGRLGGAEDRALALQYVAHPDWHVRKRAAAALGQVGLAGDRGTLEALLSDPVWWVRYRAAGALYQLRGATPEQLRALAARHPDRSAREVLERVLAEHGAVP